MSGLPLGEHSDGSECGVGVLNLMLANTVQLNKLKSNAPICSHIFQATLSTSTFPESSECVA